MTQTSEVLTDPAVIEHLRDRYREILTEHRLDDSQKGLWAPLYEELYGLITANRHEVLGADIDPLRDVPISGVPYQTWLWLRGARYVNAGEGPFAALIRDYTIIQHKLRYGYPATDAEMNRASNNIAVNFLGQWLGFDQVNPDSPLVEATVPGGVNLKRNTRLQ